MSLDIEGVATRKRSLPDGTSSTACGLRDGTRPRACRYREQIDQEGQPPHVHGTGKQSPRRRP